MNPRFSPQWAPRWALCIWGATLQTLLARVLPCQAAQRHNCLRELWYLACHCLWNLLTFSRTLSKIQAFECMVWQSELIYRQLSRHSLRRVRLILIFFVPFSRTPWFWQHHPCICSMPLLIPRTFSQRIWCRDHANLYIQCSKGAAWSYSNRYPSRNSRWNGWIRICIFEAIAE